MGTNGGKCLEYILKHGTGPPVPTTLQSTSNPPNMVPNSTPSTLNQRTSDAPTVNTETDSRTEVKALLKRKPGCHQDTASNSDDSEHSSRNSEPSSKPKLKRKRWHQTPIYSSSESESESLSKQQSKTKHKKPNLVAREEEPNAKEPLFLPSDGDGPEQDEYEVEEINNRIDMTSKDPGTRLFFEHEYMWPLQSNGSIWLRQICALVLR
ncbi:hypothetical protein C8F04DRAFT_1186609 [Mycena alexandri]|uniref:Uncharacterized protein n=1 Tax=Mycena alexandri TaxID=1745969 RepID=A0AAD6SP60_9AGAR|nr:hypothetical protein C8F04DRAFT_1186609 [Mycena alexandri]